MTKCIHILYRSSTVITLLRFDLSIIAGQATACVELIEDGFRDHEVVFDTVLAPVGGGGLLSGTALATTYLSPATKVVACEPSGADDAFRSFKSGDFVPSVKPNTIADGLLTSLGDKTWPIIRDHVDDVLTVQEETIVQMMKFVWQRMKIVIEASSAVPLAAILENRSLFEGKKVGVIISGGNVDFDRLPW